MRTGYFTAKLKMGQDPRLTILDSNGTLRTCRPGGIDHPGLLLFLLPFILVRCRHHNILTHRLLDRPNDADVAELVPDDGHILLMWICLVMRDGILERETIVAARVQIKTQHPGSRDCMPGTSNEFSGRPSFVLAPR